MKILMVHPHDVYTHPWMIRPIKIAEELIQRGHSVILACIPDDRRRKTYGIIHKNLPDKLKVISLAWARRDTLKNVRLLEELGGDVDIFHIQKADSITTFPALMAAYHLRKPVHYDWDDRETEILKVMHYSKFKVFDFYWYEKFVPKFVDTISVASRALNDLAIKEGIPQDRIFSAPVGADLKIFNPSVNGEEIRSKHHINGPVIIYSGQLDGANYLELLIQAIPIINQSIENTTFIVVGAGKSLRKHIKLAGSMNIQNILFTGYIPHDEVPKYLAAADVAVACFEDNTITRCKSPLKVVEYLASGKAIIASRVGEVIPMVEGCGFLVPPGNTKELAEKVILLLSNTALRNEYSQKARQRAENQYNWKITSDHIEEAYRLAISQPRVSHSKRLIYLSLLGSYTLFYYILGFLRKSIGNVEPGREWDP